MKTRVGNLFKRPLVMGDPNLVTGQEILVETNEDNQIVALKERKDNELSTIIAGSSEGEGGGGSEEISLKNIIPQNVEQTEQLLLSAIDDYCTTWIEDFADDKKYVVIFTKINGTTPYVYSIEDEDTLKEIAMDIYNGLPYDRNKYVIIQKEYREGDTKESVIEYYKNLNISSKNSSGYQSLKQAVLEKIQHNDSLSQLASQLFQSIDFYGYNTLNGAYITVISCSTIFELLGSQSDTIPYVIAAICNDTDPDATKITFTWESHSPYSLSDYLYTFKR